MSVPFANMPAGITDTLTDLQGRKAQAEALVKQKKEETAKTIEEGLGGLKVMLGGKGVTKKILEDPIVKKFGAQLKKKAVDGVKKAADDAMESLKGKASSLAERLTGQTARGEAMANPAAVEASESIQMSPLGEVADEGEGAIAETAFGAPDSDLIERTANIAARQAAEDARLATQSSKIAEVADQEQNFGRAAGETFDSWDTAAPPAYQAANPFTSNAVRPPTAAPELDDEPAFNAAGGAGGEAGGEAGKIAGSAGKTAVEEGVGEGAGEGAGVGLGEGVLAALDAIPFVDFFTLAAGVGLAAGAAAGKRKPDKPVMPPPSKNYASFQAGFSNI